jgi:hypothetical protein
LSEVHTLLDAVQRSGQQKASDEQINVDKQGLDPTMTKGNCKCPDAIEAEVERMLAMGREIRSHMTGNPSSDLSDLYDADGFPIEDDDTVPFDAEPISKP